MYVQTTYANLEKQATTLICMLRNKLEKQATPREAGQILSWRAGVTALRDGAPCCFVPRRASVEALATFLLG